MSSDNLRRVVMLRAIALGAALVVLMLASPLFQVHVDTLALSLICLLWAAFCGVTWRQAQQPAAQSGRLLFWHLLADVVLLTLFLIYSGGTANPLTALYLMPVAAGAALLSGAGSWIIAGSAFAAYALLWVFALPIVVEDVDAAMQMHLAGMWLTFGLSAALLIGIVARMSAALREREQRLADARERALRDERIVALGNLAASAAHRLGTPLNTALLLADEIAVVKDEQLAADARELRVQLTRCREIVQTLVRDAMHTGAATLSIEQWMQRVVTDLRLLRSECAPATDLRDGLGPRLVQPDIALTQTLVDLLDNAARAAPDDVRILVRAEGEDVIIAISDKGPGFPPQALAHAGRAPWSDKPEGMGLGLYLAHATVERLGGTLECRNRDVGAEVFLRLPATALGMQ